MSTNPAEMAALEAAAAAINAEALRAAARRACLLAGLALAGTAAAVAVHSGYAPDRAHFAALIVTGGLGLGLLVSTWPPEAVFPRAGR